MPVRLKALTSTILYKSKKTIFVHAQKSSRGSFNRPKVVMMRKAPSVTQRNFISYTDNNGIISQ